MKYFCDWSIEQGQNFEPIKIQNLSKSGQEFLVLVQVCCPFSCCKMAEIQRFYRTNSEYIESLINASENKNTKDSTRNWLKQFEKWAVERKKEVNLEKYAAKELNSTLCEFFAELRKANGDDYEPDSLHVMFSAIDRHLKSKSYPKSIREDKIFLPCGHVLEGKARKPRSEGKGKRTHRAQSLNAEEEEILWECGQLGTFTSESLANTVFWLLIQHFGLRGRQQHHDMKWRTFVSRRITTVLNLLLLVKVLPTHQDKDWTQDHVCKSLKCLAPEVHDAPMKFSVCSCQKDLPIWSTKAQYICKLRRTRLAWPGIKDSQWVKTASMQSWKKWKKNSPLRELCPDKKLTNHNGRKTVVRKMKASGIPKCEVINITGHRHERGLDPYDSGDENEQRFWSNVIDIVAFVPVTQSSSSISLPSSAVPQNQFQQVQLQRNYAPIIAEQSNTSSQVSQVRPLCPRNIMPQPVSNNVGPL